MEHYLELEIKWEVEKYSHAKNMDWFGNPHDERERLAQRMIESETETLSEFIAKYQPRLTIEEIRPVVSRVLVGLWADAVKRDGG